jgi:hypothetical protein
MQLSRQDVVYGAVRTALIGYGVGAFTMLLARVQGAPPLSQNLFLLGVALQCVLIALRWLIRRRLDAALAPQALLVLETIGDGATLLLFALATFGGVAAYTAEL